MVVGSATPDNSRHFMFKKICLLSAIIIIALTTTGCSISFKGGGTGDTDGGLFVSINKGEQWKQKTSIPTISGTPKTMAGLSVNSLIMDPGDHQAIYFGSVENGLFYTYDVANTWQIAKGLEQATINSIAVDPSSRCIIYAAINNKVYKSNDCNRSWSQTYYDNNVTVKINDIIVDHYDSKNVYLGTSRGEIIKSVDYGVSWQTIQRFDMGIKKIIISPHDSRVVFAASDKKEIYRSTDGGEHWISMKEQLGKVGSDFKDLVFAKDNKNLIFLATHYGLLKSTDNGDTWSQITLIPPEKKAVINAIAINPQDSQEIYYVTDTTFYRSSDNGQNWSVKKLPTTRAGWKLLIDPENPKIIYMGVRALRK